MSKRSSQKGKLVGNPATAGNKVLTPESTRSDGTFNVIQWPGQPNRATYKGHEVVRKDIFHIPKLAPEFGGQEYFEPTEDDLHFIFENPVKTERVVHMCTCGYPAIVVFGPGVPLAYQKKLTCMFDADNGFRGIHAPSVIGQRDFERRFAGKTLKHPTHDYD